jgi:hypothetical protein
MKLRLVPEARSLTVGAVLWARLRMLRCRLANRYRPLSSN